MSKLRVPCLKGARITSVRMLTRPEQQEIGVQAVGYQQPLMLELDTGVRLLAVRDQEANGFGCLLGLYHGSQFDVAEEP
jgi:hypothetical protein